MQRAYQRAREAIERRQRDTYPAFTRQPRQENADVFFWDESGFRAVSVHGKTWVLSGERPTYEVGLSGELFVTRHKKLMLIRSKAVHLIVGGLPAQKKAIVKEYVASTQGKLTLHFLPRYAPDPYDRYYRTTLVKSILVDARVKDYWTLVPCYDFT